MGVLEGVPILGIAMIALILGILAVAVTPQIMNWVDKSKTNTDNTTKESIEVAAQAAVLEFMEGKAIAAETYKVTSTGVVPADNTEGNTTTGGTKLGDMIKDAVGDVSDPKSSGKTYYEVAVDANGQVTVTLK